MPGQILVTGAGGQVGHELATADSRHELHALPRNELDICDAASVGAAFDAHRPDIVINAAAYTQVDRAESESEQACAVNRDAVALLAGFCAERKIPLLHISTDYVFDGDRDGAYREDDAIAPRSVYGKSKALGEEALRAALAEHIVLRTSWVFSETGANFVKTMLRLGAERDELGIVGDQHGCPTSANSIARALLQVADRYLDGEEIAWGTYHFCNSPPTTWFDFAAEIFRQAGGHDHLKLRKITTADYPTPAARPMNSVLDCGKLQDRLGISQVGWREELRRVLDCLKT